MQCKMFLKNLNIFIPLILFGIILGCKTKNNSPAGNNSSQPGPPSIPQTSQPPTPSTAGTGDSGGGNLYKGIPLESYVQKPMDLPAYKNSVQRVVDAAIPDIQFPMKYILEAKTWYFVPGPLSSLPASKIGSVVPTEQAALQNFTQIWIDKDLFDKMSEADQANLLLHELLMGFKLLKFESPQIGCFALNYGSPFLGESVCQRLDTKQAGKVSDLKVLDYEDIRHTTSQLLTMDLSTLRQPLDWRTIFNKRNFHFHTMYYISKDQSVETTYEKTLDQTRRSWDIGYRPTFGFSMADLETQIPGWERGKPIPDGTIWKSTSDCQIKIDLSGSTYNLEVQIGDYKIASSYSLPNQNDFPSSPSAWNGFWTNGLLLWQQELVPFIPVNPSNADSSHTRQREDRIVGYFDNSGKLKMISVQEWYSVSPGSHHSAFDDEILRGDYFVCALTSEIKFQRKPNTPNGSW